MEKQSKILGVLLSITSVGCLVLGFLWIDLALTYTYMEPECDSYSAELAVSLLEKKISGASEEEIMAILDEVIKSMGENVVVKKIEQKLWVENLSFQFEEGVVKHVKIGRTE